MSTDIQLVSTIFNRLARPRAVARASLSMIHDQHSRTALLNHASNQDTNQDRDKDGWHDSANSGQGYWASEICIRSRRKDHQVNFKFHGCDQSRYANC